MDGIITSSEFNNLKQDLLSIHDTINQIFSKVGVVQSKSWKLRNESSDLPIDILCNKCQYFSSDLHSTRASHVMVLELIVDRLALMLQAYVYFTDRLIGKPASSTISESPNLGPLCKKYWKRVKLLRQFVTSLRTEITNKSQELVSLSATVEKAREENLLLKDLAINHGLAANTITPPSLPPTKKPPTTADSNSAAWSDFGGKEEMQDNISVATASSARLPTQITVNNVKAVTKWLTQGNQSTDAKTQTLETAFVKCDVCNSVQDLLETLGSKLTMMSNMLKEEAQPPKRLIISPVKEAIKWCNYYIEVANNINSFTKEIKKGSVSLQEQTDFQRQAIEKLEKEIMALRVEVETEKDKNTRLTGEKNKEVEELKKQISKQSIDYHHNIKLRQVEEERLKEKVVICEANFNQLHEKYLLEASAKQDALDELYNLKTKTDSLMDMKKSSEELQDKIDTLMREHESVTGELNRYQTQNDNLIKQNKILTVKQAQLLAQLDAFDIECESMREQLDLANDSSSNTTCQLKDVLIEKNELSVKNSRLQKSIEKIQEDIVNLTSKLSSRDKKLDEAKKIIEEEKEKEETLLNYPLLVEGERIPRELNRLVKANVIRILRLEEQNRLLRDDALQKELSNSHVEPNSRPKTQSLWRNEAFKELVKSQHVFERVFSPIDYYDGIDNIINSKQGPKPQSTPPHSHPVYEFSTPPNRRANTPLTPPSHRANTLTTPYNKAADLNTPTNSPKNQSKSSNFNCSKCERGFRSRLDLELHDIYCD